jgi:hypothetical protein
LKKSLELFEQLGQFQGWTVNDFIIGYGLCPEGSNREVFKDTLSVKVCLFNPKTKEKESVFFPIKEVF